MDLVSSTAEALRDARPEVRTATLARLKELYVSCEDGTCTTHPEVARKAFPHVRLALEDPDPEVRITGARAIELFAADGEEWISELVRVLADPIVTVRLAALDALCEFGPAAAPAAPQVAERLAHAPTAEERSLAAVMLGNADAQADHLDALLDALLGDVPAVQASAAYILHLALEDEREEKREQVSRALHRLARAK